MKIASKRSKTGPKAGKRKKKAPTELLVLLLLALLASIFVGFHQTNQLIAHHDNSKEESIVHADAPIRHIGAEPLPHEDIFAQTINSCLPGQNKKCKMYVPEESGQRVALLAPPGDLTHVFFRLIQVVLGRAQKRELTNIELIPTTHIAPYGYGKTQ